RPIQHRRDHGPRLASSPSCGSMMPTQFGPTTRTRSGFAASNAACCSASPLLTELAEASADDNFRARAAPAQLANPRWAGVGRPGDDGQVGRAGKLATFGHAHSIDCVV